MAFFSSDPMTGRQFATIKDALDSMTAFNALYAYNMNVDPASLENPDDVAQWKKLVWEGVINAGGEPMEIDFFENIFGGTPTEIDAKKMYFRYNADIDRNVFSQDAQLGASIGADTTFLLSRNNHSGNGAYSYPAKGYSLYIYEDDQWVEIIDVNKSVNYGHVVTVRPWKAAYQVNIRKGKKMMMLPTQLVGGYSGPQQSSTLETTGYTNHIRPFRLRKDWELAIDLMRGYQEILQWAIFFDENGMQVEGWEPYVKTKGRTELKWAKNLLFFMGQSMDNPTILGTGQNAITVDYVGFDGYMSALKYGGGVGLDYSVGSGFDFYNDFDPVILRNDALKRTNEFICLHPKAFYMGVARNMGEKWKSNSGACTFDTFRRMDGEIGEEQIRRLGVRSYEWANFSIHMKEVSALSDTRGIGNGKFPFQAYFVPGNGLRDSKGNEIPAFQWFMPTGTTESGRFEENNVDYRKTTLEDKIGGYIAETVMMAIHCPHQHLWANPMLTSI